MKQMHCDKVERFWNLVLVLDGVQFHSVFLNTQRGQLPENLGNGLGPPEQVKRTPLPGLGTEHLT